MLFSKRGLILLVFIAAILISAPLSTRSGSELFSLLSQIPE